MKLDYLFSRRRSPARSGADVTHRHEPRLSAGGRGLPALADPDDSAPLSTPFAAGIRSHGRIDPRRMSPRQLAAWAHDMYLCRVLDWEDYCMAGFPAEMHPHYNRTVGALTGHLAQPEAPRNMIRVWEEKLAFTLRYFAADAPEVARCEKLVRLLRQNIPTRI